MPLTLLQQAQEELAKRQAAGGAGTPAVAPTAPAASAAPARTPQDQALAEMAARQQQVHPFKALATGLRNAPEALAAAPGNLVSAEQNGLAWLAEKMGADPKTVEAIRNFFPQEAGAPVAGIPNPGMASTEDVRGATDAAVNAVLREPAAAAVQDTTRHVPQNKAEEVLTTAGEFLPMVIAPETAISKLPGKAATKLAPGLVEATPGIVKTLGTAATKVAAPTIATEGSGQAARAAGASPAVENAIRIVAGALSTGTIEQGVKMRIGREVKAIVDAGPKAIQSVFDNLKAQKMSAEEAAARMREMGLPGVDAMLLDTGPATVQQAQQIHAENPAGRAELEGPLKARDKLINPGLETQVEGTVGPRQQPSDVVKVLEDRLTRATQEQSASHVNQVQDVDLQGMANELDARIPNEKDPSLIKKLQAVRDLLDAPKAQGGGLETTSAQVLKVRQAIKGMIYDANGKLREGLTDTELGALKDLYGRTNKAIEPANPSLRAADKKIEQAKLDDDAFVTGQKVYENPPAHQGGVTEVEWKQNFDKMAPTEQQALLDGINVETWRQIGVSGNNLTKLKDLIKGEGKWNHQKLVAAYGEDKVQGMMDALDNAAQLRENTREIVHGSKTASATARRDKGGKRSAGRAIADAVPDLAMGAAADVSLGGGGAGTMSAGLGHLKRFIAERVGADPTDPVLSDQAARVLKLNDPDKIVELARILATKEKLSGGAKTPVLAALLARQSEVSDRKERR